MASYANVNSNAPSPYGSGDPYYNESSGFITPQPKSKRSLSNWIKFGVPVLIAVIVAAVLGGVLGSRAHHNSSKSSAAAASSASPSGAAAASQAASIQAAIGVFPTATASLYMLPVYPSTTNTAAFTTPTFNSAAGSNVGWPSDPFQPASPAPTSLRPDRPRIIAPSYKWEVLPSLISNNPYLKYWNDSIFSNATDYYNQPVVPYYLDSGNGILDVARQIKMRIKAFSYAYRMTNDTKWADRAFKELQNAAGNGTNSFGPSDDTRWNPIHFLDTAELMNAFGIAYDWMYDVWTDQQKGQILWTLLTYGLQPALAGWNNANNAYWEWWSSNTQGNWNCVCNGGITLASLAVLGDDPTNTAQTLLGLTIPNALANCAEGVTSDGTWQETPNYWYFGVTGHAEMASALMTAAGSDFGLLTTNPGFALTGLFHMYATGPASTFSWGDNGVNLYSTTANPLLFYGDVYQHPEYVLFQRDQFQTHSDPWSMFWYTPTVSGAFWDDLPLDHFFDNHTDQWGSMRSSWTDEDALYVGIKAGTLQGHQTHNDLDCGTFVLDALGTRWFGELGDSNYLAEGYFSNDTQSSERWWYYRKRTEGQNTILVDQQNQLVTAAPTINYDSSGTVQGSSTVFDVPSNSTAFFTANLASAYNEVSSFQRGIRMINGRKQVLLQDDITATGSIMWRGHTNATSINIDSNGTSATLQIGNEKLLMQIVSPTSGATISTAQPVRFSSDPPLPAGAENQDLPNTGVTVVEINLNAGTYSLQVLFSPQWDGMSSSAYVTPPSVPISSWSLTSHN
ncbi:chondroitin AC/alginate lyase [Sparassis latifolia]